jgi:head-tail adaptor
MRAGLLRHIITLRQPQDAASETGSGGNQTYTDFATVPAAVQYIGGNKAIQNYELFVSTIIQFQIQYRQDINEYFEIRFGNKLYGIDNIKEVGYKDSLIITAELKQ